MLELMEGGGMGALQYFVTNCGVRRYTICILAADRETSLKDIDTALKRIGKNITKYLPGTHIKHILLPKTQHCIRIHIVGNSSTIKIEVTPVLRGTINPTTIQKLSASVEEMFGAAQMRLLHFTDIYGGKICAALDRQHPRDLFDIQYLLSNERITEELKNSFLVYLISHNRPMAELLDPKKKISVKCMQMNFWE